MVPTPARHHDGGFPGQDLILLTQVYANMPHPPPERGTTTRELSSKYQRAYALCRQRNADLAGARRLLLECVQNDPGNLIFTETFLQVLQRAAPSHSRWRGFWTRVAFEQAHRSRAWSQVVRHGLRLLVARPSDGHVLCGLGEALEELGHPDVALRYWMTAGSTHPQDPMVQRRCAAAFTRQGLFEEASSCWRQVATQLPHDQEAATLLSQLQTAPLADRGNSPPPLPTAVGEHDGADWQDLVELGDRLYAAGNLAGARAALMQATQMRPGELHIVELLEDLDMAAAQQRVDVARQQTEVASFGPLVASLQADLVRLQIEVFAARSARYPQDHAWKLKLAHSLKNAGNYEQACRIFDEIASTAAQPEHHVEWGECLQHQRRFDDALAHYEAAATGPLGEQLTSNEQLALYRAGVLALQLGDMAKARKYLLILTKSRPDYKDAGQHLDKTRSISDKDGFN